MVMVSDMSNYCKGRGLFLAKAVKIGAPITAYPGLVWGLDDHNLPKDNSYQILIPGTNFVIDAGNMIHPFGRGHMINECWDDNLANVKAKNHGKKCA